ncbi:DUF4959 domain-containing protein [Puteibacter caeruleilacunae]|nr:DUF4959 domain-containing protein [Puteibacter caeruleilacunae]
MKRLKLIPIILLSLFFAGCEEDGRNPLLTDTTNPGAVSNVQVENIPGGANLTYTLPSDNDLLYVLAEYTLSNGKQASTKSTLYKNKLSIEGFGDTNPYDISLYAVDRGENMSEPVKVTINPLEPPVRTISQTMRIIPDFGGAHFYWENDTEAEVAVIAMTEDTLGNLSQADVRYTNLLEDDLALRGYTTDPREFVVLLRDRWDNFSDTVKVTLEPLFEENLDKTKMSALRLPHDAPDAWGWTPAHLFDNNIGGTGYHTPQGWKDDDPLPEYDDLYPHILTIDLGVTAKLSRFKFWQRQDSWIYYHGNPRYFEVWGASELNSSGTFDGWTKLIKNGEVVKPSGLPTGQVSNTDKETASNGEEFSFPLQAEPVRYIRFVNLESWSGTTFMHMMEVDFWGQVMEE